MNAYLLDVVMCWQHSPICLNLSLNRNNIFEKIPEANVQMILACLFCLLIAESMVSNQAFDNHIEMAC